MDDPAFDKPRLAINRVYTRQGDQGDTALAGGQRVPKDSPRIEAYGTVDELNSFIGLARETVGQAASTKPLAVILLRVQHELFNLGSILATLPEDVHPKQAPLRSFVLPGGSRLNAELHICRTVCRRAERACVALNRVEEVPPETIRYLNRLSDALFVWSRWASHRTGAPETLWEPNQSTSGLSET
jgi:cob(I)alamin adenosyltransferase